VVLRWSAREDDPAARPILPGYPRRARILRADRNASPDGSANVASTTTLGACRRHRGRAWHARRRHHGLPSTLNASGASANAVSVSRSASSAWDFGWLAARAMIRSVGSPLPAV